MTIKPSQTTCASTSRNAPRPRQGVPAERDSDTGPIPPRMLDDLRYLLWRMERLPLYWAIGMGVVLGSVFIGGVILFATADAARQSHSNDAIGGLALAVLIAMAYSPFFNWWFEDKLEARWLREALYPQTLEDLANYMAVCQMGSRKKVAARLRNLGKIWVGAWMERAAHRPRAAFQIGLRLANIIA